MVCCLVQIKVLSLWPWSIDKMGDIVKKKGGKL